MNIFSVIAIYAENESFKIPIAQLLIRKEDISQAVDNLGRGYPSMTEGPLEVAFHPKIKRYELTNGYHRLVETLMRGQTEVTVKSSGDAEWAAPVKKNLFTPKWNLPYYGMEDFNEIYLLKRL